MKTHDVNIAVIKSMNYIREIIMEKMETAPNA